MSNEGIRANVDNVLAAIEKLEENRTPIPYPIAIKLADVFAQLRAYMYELKIDAIDAPKRGGQIPPYPAAPPPVPPTPPSKP